MPGPSSRTRDDVPAAARSTPISTTPPRRAVAQGVGDEVRERLAHARGVSRDRRRVRRPPARAISHAAPARGLGEVLGDGVCQHREIDLLEVQRQRARLGLRDRRDIADEPLERLGVREDGAQVVVVARVDPVQHRLEPAAHDRERRAQLVRDVGEERAPLRVDRAEARAHRVERRARARAPRGLPARARAPSSRRARSARPPRSAPRWARSAAATRAARTHEDSDAADEDRERGDAQARGGGDRADRDEGGPDARRHDAAHRQQDERRTSGRSAA